MNDLQNAVNQTELVKQYLETKDEKYLELLYESIDKMIRSIAVNFVKFYSPYELEDLVAEAKLAIYVSLDKYEMKNDTKFSTFAYQVTTNCLASKTKTYRTKKRYAGNVKMFETEVIEGVTFGDMIGEDETILSELAFREMSTQKIQLIISHFSAEDALILLAQYYNFEIDILCKQLDLTRRQFRDRRRKLRMTYVQLEKNSTKINNNDKI